MSKITYSEINRLYTEATAVAQPPDLVITSRKGLRHILRKGGGWDENKIKRYLYKLKRSAEVARRKHKRMEGIEPPHLFEVDK